MIVEDCPPGPPGPTGERVVSLFFAGVVLSVRHEQVLVQNAGLSRTVGSAVVSFIVLLVVVVVVVVHSSARRQQHLVIVVVILQVSIGVLRLTERDGRRENKDRR